MEIILPKYEKVLNRRFVSLMDNTDRYLILYGGRGSSKSVFAAKKLIYRCLREKYFRFILVRSVYNTIKNSQWQTIKDIVTDWGLEEFFVFNVNPLEIRCTFNGNKFIAAGCDAVAKLKSIKDPTGVWYEEDVINESDWITITTSIRTTKSDYLQEIFTINPEVKGRFEDNWFWKRFFQGVPYHSFQGMTKVEIGKNDKKEIINLRFTVHHSTYKDNRWIGKEFMAFLEDMARTNPYYYTIYTLGFWGNKQSGGVFYNKFNRQVNVRTSYAYDPTRPLYISFDFNIRPYLTLTIWQVDHYERLGKRRATQIDEILGVEPHNRTKDVCELFARRYADHKDTIYIFGDPSGVQEDTKSEQGVNNYSIIAKSLKAFKTRFRIQAAAPSVTARGEWINSLFSGADPSLEIFIGVSCHHAIMDYAYGKEDSDGTKLKEKFKDDEGIRVERYHHITDANDYLLTELFRKEFNTYLRGNRQREYLVGEAKSNFAHTEE